MKKLKLGIVVLLLMLVAGMPEAAEAATQSQREACKQEILEILYAADTSTHTIYNYRIKTDEFNALCKELRYGEGAEIFGAYTTTTKFSYTYTILGGYVKTIQLINVNEDALTRYDEMVSEIDSIVAGIEDDMTDLDKLIYLHDAVVESVAYRKTTDAMYTASGALVDKQAVCSGYAKALNVLLHRVGIDATYVTGISMDHGWSYVELNGQWYHVDPTWDDTRTPVSGKVSRANLLRNDTEFGQNHGTWEVIVEEDSSTSTAYEDWLVHDIVGEMCFEGGLWYYLDTESKTVVAVDAVGNRKEELFEYVCLGNVSLVDATEDLLILNVNGKEIGQTVEQWKAASEAAEEKSWETEEGVVLYPLDFSESSLWRTGHYNPSTGTYGANKNRVCLNDVIENAQSQYTVTISDENYKIAIRELNERKKLMSSVELGNGDVYIPAEGVCYLGISIYNCVQEKGITFATYEELFANEFTVGLNLYKEESVPGDTEEETLETEDAIEEIPEIGDIVVEMPKPEDEVEEMPVPENPVEKVPESEDSVEETPEIEDTEEDVTGEESGVGQANAFPLDLTDLSNWRTGHYNPYTATYGANRNRICLNDVVENTQDGYLITVSDENYRIIIKELNERKRLMSSVDVGNGDIYVPAEGVCYLGISVYNCIQEKGITYEVYEALFTDGFEIGFFVVE